MVSADSSTRSAGFWRLHSAHMALPLSRFLNSASGPSSENTSDRLSTSGCRFNTSEIMVEPQRPVDRTSTGAIRFTSSSFSSRPYASYPNASSPGAQASVSRRCVSASSNENLEGLGRGMRAAASSQGVVHQARNR